MPLEPDRPVKVDGGKAGNHLPNAGMHDATQSLASMAVPRLSKEPCVTTAKKGIDFGQPVIQIQYSQTIANFRAALSSNAAWICFTL